MRKTLAILLLAGTTFLTGCGSSENFVVTNNGQLAVAPTCVDDAYTANSNATLTVTAANGVLANDAPAGGTATFPTTSTQGGTVAGLADGGFTYTPPVNFTGTDTFAYTVSNSFGSATCTVTLTVNAVNGFFVDATNGNDTTGTFTNGLPFATIQAAVTAAGTGQDIVVRPGTYTGVVTLLDNQRLLGSGSQLAANTVTGAARPVTNSQIVLANGNTVDFVRVDGFAGDGITGTGSNGGTITNCEAQNLTNFGIGARLISVTGNWTVSNNNFSNNASGGIQVTSDTGDVLRGVFNNNTLTGNGSGSFGFTAGQNAQMRVQVTNNIMTGTIAPGATFQVIVGGTALFCADITGNTNDDAYEFSNDNTNADLQVEQFAQLTSLNSGGATVTIGAGSVENPIDVADGTCGF